MTKSVSKDSDGMPTDSDCPTLNIRRVMDLYRIFFVELLENPPYSYLRSTRHIRPRKHITLCTKYRPSVMPIDSFQLDTTARICVV